MEYEINKELPIFSVNKEIREERKQKYIAKAQKIYSNVHPITNDEYREIYENFQQDKQISLKMLLDKSIYDVAYVVANIYAKYDIEDNLPFEEGLSFCLMKLREKIANFKTLPKYRAEYSDTVLNYYIYNILRRYSNMERIYFSHLEFIDDEITALIDSKKEVIISDKNLINESVKKEFRRVLNNLPQMWREIIIMRFGLDGNLPMSSEEIAKQFNLSESRINKIIKNSLIYLRQPKNTKILKEFI